MKYFESKIQSKDKIKSKSNTNTNSLDKDIQMTYEVPSDSPQGKIVHRHYVKPMASRLVVQNESAIGERELRTIHTQEIIRILRNCHEDVPEEEINMFLSDYM